MSKRQTKLEKIIAKVDAKIEALQETRTLLVEELEEKKSSTRKRASPRAAEPDVIK